MIGDPAGIALTAALKAFYTSTAGKAFCHSDIRTKDACFLAAGDVSVA